MELDANVHAVLNTSLRFEGAQLVSSRGNEYRTNVLLEFRSFLPSEPFQVLERVSAEILEGKNTFECPADRQARYELREEVPNTTGKATLQPFRANLLGGMPINASTIELHPLPGLRATLPRQGEDDAGQRVWGDGFAFEDVMFPRTLFRTATPRTEATEEIDGATPAHVYALEVAGADGKLLVFPGGRTLAKEATADLVARLSDEGHPEPRWTRHADHCLHLPAGTFEDPDTLHRRYVALCALLRATTGFSPGRVSTLSPVDAESLEGSFTLFRDDPRDGGRSSIETIPLQTNGISLASLLDTCWPRVEHLLQAGFNFVAVSGWFHRGKDLSPIGQGFLNLFVFLECLKAHWISLREGITMKEISTDFAGNVNRTLKELLGQRKKVNPLVEFRNRMIHQGVSDLPVDERLERYGELYRLCAAAYLSLVGWTDPWNALQVPRDASPRAVTEKAWWTPADLNSLLPIP